MKDAISSQEEIILLCVGSLEPEAYAYGIKKELKEQASLSWSLGTIHTILYRLEGRGLLRSRLGGASNRRGGRSKRLYALTSRGYGIVEQVQQVRQALWTKVMTNRVLFNR